MLTNPRIEIGRCKCAQCPKCSIVPPQFGSKAVTASPTCASSARTVCGQSANGCLPSNMAVNSHAFSLVAPREAAMDLAVRVVEKSFPWPGASKCQFPLVTNRGVAIPCAGHIPRSFMAPKSGENTGDWRSQTGDDALRARKSSGL